MAVVKQLIAQFGTFEVENYGDLLFPLILEKELASRLSDVDLQLYSPLPSALNPLIRPIFAADKQACFSQNSQLKALIIGGGDIISFCSRIAPYYTENWHHKISPHTACWAIPIIRRPPGIPVIWNAPGVPYEFTKDQAILLRLLAAQTDYLSVRDEISLSYLQGAGIEQPISVVPDTALNLPKHFSAEQLEPLAKEIFESFGFAIGEPLLVQMHIAIDHQLIPHMVDILNQLKAKLGRPILLLPIGYCHNDDLVLKKLKEASKGSFWMVEKKLDLLTIAAVIAHAGCFIGTSLHGNITAFAYQVPHIIYNACHLTKLKGFARLIEQPELCLSGFKDLLDRYHFLKQKPSLGLLRKLSAQVDTHFDRMVSLLFQANAYPKRQDASPILENYIHILNEMQNCQKELAAMQTSKAWHLACFLKKLSDRIPLAKKVLKRIPFNQSYLMKK